MKNLIFIDTEVSTDNKRVLDMGAVDMQQQGIHTTDSAKFLGFIQHAEFLGGHNFINFDNNFLIEKYGYEYKKLVTEDYNLIDTLYLSALLFPSHPYHHLVKNDKLTTEAVNNPLNDAINAQKLFLDEAETFNALPAPLQSIYYGLLKNTAEFGGFFRYIGYSDEQDISDVLISFFDGKICSNAPVGYLIKNCSIELAYAAAIINTNNPDSITPPWILHKYQRVQNIIHMLRGTACVEGCKYCNSHLDARNGLKNYFGYENFRTYDGMNLQQEAVETALKGESLIAVFPTGGGKSITFQLPALMAGYNERGLTVVISPLQSLMQDQVYNLEMAGITDAVTINGLLDPVERAESIRRVAEGEAKLLYISPELLRSNTIEKLLTDRSIVRFVIDEAHCFSAWGQDFRVDYLYIAEFIKKLCKKKGLRGSVPVSCFTATAKQNVISDICRYFKDGLDIDMKIFAASASRSNLRYTVIRKTKSEKYAALRNLLNKKCPTIIYTSRTRETELLAAHLRQDGYAALPYHGKMDKKEKSENQLSFINGDTDIMVATSAFGMGVDKKDVGMVIHYNISDSLENYLQEAGRAGRSEEIVADCYILFDEDDLNAHFTMLNQTKISIQEIQQTWRAIKDMTKHRSKVCASALEIARKSGWNENINEIETRVKTAINALEEAGYIKRGQNMPRIYADSILARNVAEAREKIEQCDSFHEKEKEQAVRIIIKMLSSRSRSHENTEVPETRIDYIADDLGMTREEVLKLVELLREAGILADAKDLTAYFEDTGRKNNTNAALFKKLEEFIYGAIKENEIIPLKKLNEEAAKAGIKKASVDKIRIILNFWTSKNWIVKEINGYGSNAVKIAWKIEKEAVHTVIERKWRLIDYILEYLPRICDEKSLYVSFSELELLNGYNKENSEQEVVSNEDLEMALLFMSRTNILKIEGGFLVTYNSMNIERIVMDNKIKYKSEDYKKLRLYYEQKVQMIHIVGEYARKMTADYDAALQFADDYFKMEYNAFLKKYFNKEQTDEIKRTVTPEKFQMLFGSLSPAQLDIINNNTASSIVVAAGPGSGKTRLLVHKLASLLMLEDVKHEQLLMLTFSRTAAMEFRRRLSDLIGDAAKFIEIKTFHSYCFDILGRIGNINASNDIVEQAVQNILNEDVELLNITKNVLVIDEAQDMDEKEYELVNAIWSKNDDMRVIAVGDDDQNIYGFRNSDSKYMRAFLDHENSAFYELVDNYRSMANLVQYANIFVKQMKERMKTKEIHPVQKDFGQISIIEYDTHNLVVPLVEKTIADGIYKDTCILTFKNDEAMQITALLQRMGINAALVQELSNFTLKNLDEIRYFNGLLNRYENNGTISAELWKAAVKQMQNQFSKSRNLPVCMNMFENFISNTPGSIYISDWQLFIEESDISDFCYPENDRVTVATMHKSKGHEYDHVIIMLADFQPLSDEKLRLLYVALTRARKTLTIHYNNRYLIDKDKRLCSIINHFSYEKDVQKYEPAEVIRMQPGYQCVFLSFFEDKQSVIDTMYAGECLEVNENGCFFNKTPVLLFSKMFKADLQDKIRQGYKLWSATVNYIVYWKDPNTEKELKIILPEIEMRRNNDIQKNSLTK